MRSFMVTDVYYNAPRQDDEDEMFSGWSTSKQVSSTASHDHHQNRESDDERRPLLIMLFSFGGAGAVLIVSTLFLCCYIYRIRVRRRNYPLSSSTQRNRCTSKCSSSVITTTGCRNGIISGCCTNRHRSPAASDGEMEDFEPYSGTIRQQRTNNVVDDRKQREPELNAGRRTSAATQAAGGFDNPVYPKFGETPAAGSFDDSASLYAAAAADGPAAIRRSSSPNSAIIPGLPSMLIIDESGSADDRRRLVPNDSLSLEIDRSQRWLRSCLEMQRRIYTEHEEANDDQQQQHRPSAVDTADGAAAARNNDDSDSEKTMDVVADAKPKKTPQQLLVAFPQSRKRLHRRLAKNIAKDRVLENSVNFTCELSTPSSPSSACTQQTFVNNNNGNNHNIHCLTVIDGKVQLGAAAAAACVKKDEFDDDDDLELIFKERTPL